MQQRNHHRYPLHLAAQISAQGSNVHHCTVNNFCLGGVLISFTGTPNSTPFAEQLSEGGAVVIHLNLPTKKSTISFQLKSALTRITDSSAGLAFHNPDPAALQALDNFARSHSHGDTEDPCHWPQREPDNIHRILALCRRSVADHLSTAMGEFFRAMF